jgi:hypothetical protein
MGNLTNKIGVRTVPVTKKPLQCRANLTAAKKSTPAFGAGLNWRGLYYLDEFIANQPKNTATNTKFSPKALETGFKFLTSIAHEDPALFVKFEPPKKVRQLPEYKNILLKHIIPSHRLPREQTIEVINKNSDVFEPVQTHKLKDIVEHFSDT